ncbi:MAG: hypothetical protein IT582_06470 [Opitutaceae bacterium]|nr:hypothetical protein [Opitutaceae bacterium]
MPAAPAQPPRPPATSYWFWAAVALTAVKLWFVSGQTIYAIGPAFHDDRLFLELAEHFLNGAWLGPYDQLTLAKGPLYSLFLAVNFWLGLPLLITQQLLYILACAALVAALRPWFRPVGLRFALYACLLLNPMSWDASNLTRVLRQGIYTPLTMLVIAGLIALFARRHESARRMAVPAAWSGLALGAFWLTREEGVWLFPTIGLLWLGLGWSLRCEWRTRWRQFVLASGCFIAAYALPVLAVSWQNYRHYGWFGTVEFRAAGFKNAYGALARIAVGPDLPKITVSRQMREAAYAASPTFALLRPHFEGPVGEHWMDRETYSPAERQILGGWFMWALRDAFAEAGLAPDAATALSNYQKIADDINAACDEGRLPAHAPRSGFFPRITRRDIEPLWQMTLEYLGYFGRFQGFTAWSLDSVGDYAELKIFRDYVGTHLSYAPRSPDPFPPEQDRLHRWQVSHLETTGRALTAVIGWIGPLLLLVGAARLIESVWRRRVSYLSGLAVALFASVAAYLAINILITVLAFRNVSPAAMAAAYPLYLLGLFMIGFDAARAWGRAMTPAHHAESTPSRWRWLLPLGAALVVFGARLREIHLFGGDVPYNDQWFIEAKQLIAPWLDGALRPWTFFLPHFEHLPVWTRLLAWLEVALTRRWDPLVQMTVNSALYGGFIWLVARWLWRNLAPSAAGFVTVLLILGGALPFAWENIAWGFQSQFPLALLLLWIHAQGALNHTVGSRRWWLAQAAGVAGLFTLASMWLAPLALVATCLWTGRGTRREWLVPLVTAVVGALLLAVVGWRSAEGYAFAQTTRTAMDFAHSLLHLLGWPTGLPGAAAVLVLPWCVHALRLRQQVEATPADRLIFGLGLWAGLQAAGLAYARAGDLGDYVSRYGDVLFIGLLANALALTRLTPPPGRTRAGWLGLALLWGGLALSGLLERSREGHARYFHEHAVADADLRRNAVQSYLHHGDRALLEQPATRWVLSQNPEVVTALLDRPEFRALLPASVNPANTDSLAGRFVRRAQTLWPWWIGAGVLVLSAGGMVWYFKGGARPTPLAGLTGPIPFIVSLGVALGSLVALAFWSQPLVFNRDARWLNLFGGEAALSGMTFDFAVPTEFPHERLQGAAPLQPVELRNRLYGTAPAGPALTCVVYSSPFSITRDWLIVPYAGYPISPGNGLRVQLLSPDDARMEQEISCPGPNGDGLDYWAVDLRGMRGRRARLVLYDGRVDTEAWVATAPPIPADSPEIAANLARRLRLERHSALQLNLAAFALVGVIGASLTWRRRRN